MGLFERIFGQKQTSSRSFRDYGPEFIVQLARSLELPDWAVSLPSYTVDEQSAIDDVFARFTQMTDSVARERGGEHTSFHPDLAEPIKRALYEAGLSNFAVFQWRAFPMEMAGLIIPVEVDSSGCPDKWPEIASTYLKCYLCNLNPFALIRLAQLLMQCRRKRECDEVIEAAASFRSFAMTNHPDQFDVIAYKATSSFFYDSDFASLYEDGGGYSKESIARLLKEVKSVA